MVMRLLRLARGWSTPRRGYYVLAAGWDFFHAMAFTLALVYQLQVAGLTPFQLIVVGTVMELTCFLAEVPTGVVADLYSRKLSIIIGFVLIGAGIVVQGAVPAFWWILAAQVVWGIGFAFTSGAVEAWITDEAGPEHVLPLFTRGTQIGLVFTFVGTLAAGALGIVSLRLPLLVAGVGFAALAVVLAVIMEERNFTPVRPERRESFAHMRASFTAGLAQARRRPVVRSFLLISLLSGLSSEAFDRLWTARILEDFALPSAFGAASAVWFTVFALIGHLVALVASVVTQRLSPVAVNAAHPGALLAVLVIVQAGGIAGLALSGNLWFAVGAVWIRDAARVVSEPIQAAWLNRSVDSGTRATVLSINSQFNGIGQIAGGPPLGALAGRTSIPVALLVSAGLLVPAALVFARLRGGRAGPGLR
ncbi:MFS transporter [Stackebrandtia soli]|uniref:MFS transporter n=1 Tax=Stackebrandtia soli TaxID=1892856 RepID=UPI0039EA3FFE